MTSREDENSRIQARQPGNALSFLVATAISTSHFLIYVAAGAFVL